MNQPAKSHEPSMEEILASIRRIIADDDAKSAPAANAAPATPPAPVVAAVPAPMPVLPPSPAEFLSEIPPAQLRPVPEPEPEPEPELAAADILELTEEMRAPEPEPAPASFKTVDAQPDVIFSEPSDEPEPEPEPEFAEASTVADEAPLDNAPLDNALEEARRTLTQQMDEPLLSRSASAAVDSAFASLTHTVLSQNARTLDDLVKDMLRPMLKAWLDDNLPSLVERLVRAEIERVSRGR
jgi:cell pole-organizing protein PopZ